MQRPDRTIDQTVRIKNKHIVNELVDRFRDVTPDTVDDYLAGYWNEDAEFHGFHPINLVSGRKNIGEEFYKRYLRAFPDARKQLDFLFGGESDGNDWVVTAGNLTGNFMEEWLGIPPTKLTTWVRFVEFFELKDGKIVQSKMFFDLVSLLRQAGYKIMDTIAPEIVIPGPEGNNGIILGESNPFKSMTSRKLCESAIGRGMMMLQRADKTTTPDEITLMIMRYYWHEDMVWYGPDCAGSMKGIYEFEANWELPWELTMSGFRNGIQFSLFAEDSYVCWGGYPSISARHSGDELFGLPASDQQISIRNANIFCCEGDYIAAHWCLFDMADLLSQLGVDVLERVREGRIEQSI